MTIEVIKDDQRKGVKVNFDYLSDEVDIPELVRQHANMLRFPEKLMLLMTFVERACSKRGKKPEEACISWTRDGNALVIRHRNELVNHFIPQVFHSKGSFASFTRKLYRWGFRQKDTKTKKLIASTGGVKVFFHEHFQRDKKELMVNMISITAEKINRANPTLPHSMQDHSSLTSSIPQQKRNLENSLQSRSRESFQYQIPQTPTVPTRDWITSRSPFLFGNADRNQHVDVAAASPFRPFMPSPYAHDMETNLLQSVVAIELKQKQDQLLASTLHSLLLLAEQQTAPWTALRRH